jgi:cell division protein FtsQ
VTAVALRRSAAPPKRKPAARRRPAAAAPPRPVTLPVAPHRLRRLLLSVFLPLGLLAALGVLALAGVPQRWWREATSTVAAQGFVVRHFQVAGAHEMGRMPIYAAALPGGQTAIWETDIGAIRERLLALPWVADASVSRTLPDTLSITITERRPAALWQFQHRLHLVDVTGRVLATQGLARFAKLPLIVGPGANEQAGAALALMAREPALTPRIEALTLVGGRRWDVRFETGEVLSLPDTDPDKALSRFARLQAQGDLLGKGIERFDMRLPGKMLVRGPAIRQALDAAAKAAKAEKAAKV